MEVKTEVRPHKVQMKCDECEIGFMETTGVIFQSNPPQYQHKCNNIKCGNVVSYMKPYPIVEYMEIHQAPSIDEKTKQ